MDRIAATCVAFAIAAVPCWAQAPAQVPPLEQNQGTPPGRPAQMQVSPSEGNFTTANLSGQTVYTAKGHKLGIIAAMSPGNHGEQAASVAVVNYPDMSGKTVLIPVSTLRPRGAGGYLTTLSATELRVLPASGTGQAQ